MDIYDIARKSGYSIATVSRVINNSANVSTKARETIMKVIAENDYSPNRVARSLATNESSLIGIIVPDIRKYFEREFAYELEKRLQDRGYMALLGDSGSDLINKKKYLDLYLANKVDGIICVGSSFEEEDFYAYLLKIAEKIPIAMINSNPIKKSDNISYVYIDEIDAMDQALSHLHSKGYKHPIFVSLEQANETRSYITKKAGFIEALGFIFPDVDYVEYGIRDIDNDMRGLYKFLKKNPHIDAICFEQDYLAVQAFKYFVEHRIDIPAELAMIGFDNIDVTDYSSKKITSIDQNISLQAEITVNNLIELTKGNILSENSTIVKAKLIVKETT